MKPEPRQGPVGWEYKQVSARFATDRMEVEYSTGDVVGLNELLEQLGAAGWEMVGMVHTGAKSPDGEILYAFKRPTPI